VVAVESDGVPGDGETTFLVDADTGRDLRSDLSRTIVGKGWDLLELTSVDVSLEDVFIDLVTEEVGEIPATDDQGVKEAVL
jgi:ABC-2 type transport system ATP-binding protein